MGKTTQYDFWGKDTTRGRKAIRNNIEHQQQSAFVTRVFLSRQRYPQVWASMYAVPNGAFLPKKIDAKTGKRVCLEMQKLKEQGLKPGVNDVNIDLACGGYHGLRLEFKSQTGRQSKEQKNWQATMQANGYCYVLCRTQDEAWNALMDYLQLSK